MDIIYAGIRALLIDFFPTYDANAIFKAYENNYVLPNDKYIVMTCGESISQMEIPISQYNTTTEEKEYTQLDSTNVIVDFYGTGSSELAKKFRAYLSTLSCGRFLIPLGLSIHQVRNGMNLSHDFDRGKYQQRHIVNFSVFVNNEVNIALPGFNNAVPGVILADVQGIE
ncbi:MAG: hypothetical protein [Caudoviricetes sp.]|nr:MAG: hypothetical protein [Caudoviricetes sp.]